MPLIIGHAGAGGEAPENTLAGVRRALAAGVDGIEIDVQLCADGVPVLMHDATADRTTNLTGRIRTLSLSALQAADCGGGEPVPTLAEVLREVDGRCTVMCELKVEAEDGRGDAALVHAVLQTIAAQDARRWCAVHSFDGAIVRAARHLEPRVSAALIVGAVDEAGMARMLGALLKRHAQAISVQHTCITPELVRMAKRQQVTLWCWTANHEADWARLVDAGVDGIMTDEPRRLLAFLATRG